MSSSDENNRFFAMAIQLSLLSKEQSDSLEAETRELGQNPFELLSEKGLLSAVQLDILQTMLAPEKIVPGYKILDVVGLGGMGVIYRARQLMLNREVALKTILRSQVGAPHVARRFQQEAQAVARLQHPHIVTAYDFGERDGRFYFAMELVDGVNADQYLKQQGPLEESIALAITLQAVSGLAQAHEQNIIHRDIKPANLLLTNPPKGYPLPDNVPLVKIADFGLAFLTEQGEDRTRLTSLNSAIGSPNYLAPEQLESDGADCRVDIYALGATLYHFLAGEAPFKANSLNQILSLKLSGKLMSLSELNAKVSSETVSLVEHMMASDPEKRISDYGELWKQVSQLLDRTATGGMTGNTVLSHNNITTKMTSTSKDNDFDKTVLVSDTTISGEVSATGRGKPLTWVKLGLLAALLILIGGGGYAWMQASRVPPRPQLESGPGVNLFTGVNLSGWKLLEGQVSPGEGEEGERYLVVDDESAAQIDLCQRLISLLVDSEDCPENYVTELQIELVDSDSVTIGFASSTDGAEWGIRLTPTQAELVKSDNGSIPNGKEQALFSMAIDTQGLNSVKLMRDREYWFLFLNGSQIAWVPLDETIQDGTSILKLSSAGGAAYFSDLKVFSMRERRNENAIIE
ncbi:Serine/threonine-protein kinase PrkC [Polystyrenella longa]|uniref:Serine/threonine-protein kinase PrkC n=1 Tax=Polystyrenella longa TaxID=2528007 RepID=A0A518CKP8_9PLAN|nr:serine/threonine-protein kinase [Polystyrenella longa]QDU79796.1 Serine/threonine-protein kinase PrkC [Polystyrenella longa]